MCYGVSHICDRCEKKATRVEAVIGGRSVMLCETHALAKIRGRDHGNISFVGCLLKTEAADIAKRTGWRMRLATYC